MPAPQEGPPTLSPCTRLDGMQCVACVQLDDLERSIKQTKLLLAQMIERRLPLKSKINQNHDLFIQRLPPEVSSYIFILCLPRQASLDVFLDCEDKQDQALTRSVPLALGAVCKRWREIAWETPQLWAIFSLDLYRTTSPAYRPLIQEWLNRSRHIPLYIHIYGQPPISTDKSFFMEDLVVQPIISIIRNYVHRCKVLCLATKFISMVQIIRPEVMQLHPLLENITLLAEDSIAPCVSLSHIFALIGARPRRLRLSVLNPHELGLCFDNLTEFDAAHLFLDDVCDVIRHALQLERCTLEYIVEKINYPIPPPIVHQHIILLRLRYVTNKIWDCITLPSLAELNFTFADDGLIDGFSSFIERSVCSPKILSIIGGNGDTEAITRLMYIIPSVERLSFINANVGDSFFQHIGKTPTGQSHNGTDYLPNLHYLHISGNVFFNFLWPSMLGLIPDPFADKTVQCRPLSRVEIEIYKWDSADRENIRPILTTIMDAGINITIKQIDDPILMQLVGFEDEEESFGEDDDDDEDDDDEDDY